MKTISIFLCFAIWSCGTSLNINSVNGEYKDIGKDYRDILKLLPDSTFFLERHSFDVHLKCSGKWSLSSKHSIILKCAEESFPAGMSNSYMQKREWDVEILTKRKLRLDNTVLKRK